MKKTSESIREGDKFRLFDQLWKVHSKEWIGGCWNVVAHVSPPSEGSTVLWATFGVTPEYEFETVDLPKITELVQK